MSRTTTLDIAITLSTKKAVFTGDIAIREKVDLVVSGFGTAAAADLIVALISDGVLIALLQGLTTGTTYTGTLDLNTQEAVDLFDHCPANASKKVFCVIWDETYNCLVLTDWLWIKNNPYDSDMEDPVAVDPIGGVTYAPISKGVDGGNSHDHLGGDGGTIAHSSLSGVGNLTHTQIDTLLAFLQGTAALGTLRYSAGKWYMQDANVPALWHEVQAGGGASAGYLVLGAGVSI